MMAFFPTIVGILLFLSLNAVYSSDLDQELRTTLAVSQDALAHQSQALRELLQTQERNQLDSQGISQALAHQSQALSQLLQTQERNQLDSQVVSQALIKMAQGFQTTISQLSQELSTLIQLNKELTTQQSSSLTELTDMAANIRMSQSHVSEKIVSSQKNMTEELTGTLTILLNQNSEKTTEVIQELCQTLPQVTTPSSESETFPQVPTSPTSLVPPEAKRVSDGVFLIVQMRKTWEDAKNNCQEMGGYLASPPSDMDAFIAFVYNAVGRIGVWLGGKEEASQGYKYLDGNPVNPNHWIPGQPDYPNTCVIFDAGVTPPLWDARCSRTYYSICRFR